MLYFQKINFVKKVALHKQFAKNVIRFSCLNPQKQCLIIKITKINLKISIQQTKINTRTTKK